MRDYRAIGKNYQGDEWQREGVRGVYGLESEVGEERGDLSEAKRAEEARATFLNGIPAQRYLAPRHVSRDLLTSDP